MTRLHHAVQSGDLGSIQSLIQSGISVNCRDEHGQTALHYAAQSGFIECIELLTRHGADLRSIDNSGFSPLLWAVIAGQESATRKLFFTDARASSTSADGKSALAWAASLGSSAIVRMLVEHRASMGVDPRTAQQTLPLEEAAASGNLDIVGLLLDRGEDANGRDRDGWCAIHWAAEEGHCGIVALLLTRGANPDALSSYGTSPLHCAANGGHGFIVDLLLKHGADPLKSTCHGWTALHHAAFMGHSHVMKCLLEDARIRSTAFQQDNHGWAVTNLRQAVAIGSVHMIKLLVNLGHNINGVDSGRRTALYYAAKKRMLSIVDLLLDLGADPNILPIGRRIWEDFVSGDVLQRLKQAGYTRREPDPEVDHQIRQILRVQRQRSESDQPDGFAPEESASSVPESLFPRRPELRSSSSQASSAPSASETTRPTAPSDQPNDHKRKKKPGRSPWWKRIVNSK
ncbi:uncharacterized protein MYCFIDRAFT_149777 [Pseudocercospora fijiensis CIRAD86]|uniref:Uncharacterized protein n=1 Tax=Pseudocercospora fijiensis (strain CIRAD86) TaxID=383855 RepID=N1Q8I0_PSEFD|nr:uncharacterized protein MYCFIDRAFT_149777 [Pseudocercospora fijiensis CIRAD86]EME89174.1 hypothetical protein MYCFIDRAFT_149777 [Pseudocercospora fijiensis CIRAD86]